MVSFISLSSSVRGATVKKKRIIHLKGDCRHSESVLYLRRRPSHSGLFPAWWETSGWPPRSAAGPWGRRCGWGEALGGGTGGGRTPWGTSAPREALLWQSSHPRRWGEGGRREGEGGREEEEGEEEEEMEEEMGAPSPRGVGSDRRAAEGQTVLV